MTDRAKCGGCGSVAAGEDGLCKPCRIERDEGPEARSAYFADLGRKGARAANANRAKGVPADLVPDPPETLEDAVEWASWTAHGTAIGLLTTQQAREITQAVRAFVQAVERRDEKGELEEFLERKAETRRGTMKAS